MGHERAPLLFGNDLVFFLSEGSLFRINEISFLCPSVSCLEMREPSARAPLSLSPNGTCKSSCVLFSMKDLSLSRK